MRSVYAQALDFVAESMDKGVRVGAGFTKQWHGHGNTDSFVKKNDLRVVPTGGVPTRTTRQDMYQSLSRLVANGRCKRANRQGYQSKRESCQ